MDEVKFTYGDMIEIFGEERKIELFDGVIMVCDRTFDEVVDKYLELKAKKQEASKKHGSDKDE